MNQKKLCKCGHLKSTHFNKTKQVNLKIVARYRTVCLLKDCDCKKYEPVTDEEEIYYERRKRFLKRFGKEGKLKIRERV